jgi:hypothetical protein
MPFNRSHRLVLASLFLSAVFSASALAASFSDQLTPEERAASGVSKLTPQQVAHLDNLVERELVLATQGNVPSFAGTFADRRSAPERAKAGIDKMSPGERAQLNALVDRTLASRPISEPTTAASIANYNAIRGVKPRTQLHGEVSLIVGTSGGGNNFYGGSFYVEQSDPAKGYSIAIGYSELHGKGLAGLYGPYGWYRYPYRPYGPYGYDRW